MAEWIVIIEMVIEFLRECMENRNRAAIKAGLLDPGPAEILAMRKILRKQGLRGRALRDKTMEGFGQLAVLGSAGIDELLDEAEEK